MPKLPAFRNALRIAMAVAMVAASSVALAAPLRVCSDPDNLPFSKSEGSTKGLYIDLAELIGKRLGVPVEYVWYLTFNQRRALRNSLDGCDAYFALPADPDYKVGGAVKTAPFMDVRYAVVTRPRPAIATIDELKGKTLGVTFGSTPHVYFSILEGFGVKSYRGSEEVIAAIEAGEVDAGVLWGPHIGYLNQSVYKGYWQLTPIAGKGLGGPVAVAVPTGKDALKEKIEAALAALQPEIRELMQKYGFPGGTPLPLDKTASGEGIGKHLADVGGARGVAAAPVRRIDTVSAAAQVGRSDRDRYLRRVSDEPVAERASDGVDVEQVRAMFNSRCAHCHSQNGASPQPERDLRRLSGRYGDTWRDVARTTITKGRSEYGMPIWGETLTADPDYHPMLSLDQTPFSALAWPPPRPCFWSILPWRRRPAARRATSAACFPATAADSLSALRSASTRRMAVFPMARLPEIWA